MKQHDAFLELAAVAIDFELTASEQTRLESHLATCPACLRAASALHADARAIAALPPVRLSERRADALIASILRRPAVSYRSLRLLAVAALLTMLVVGGVLVGAELLRRANEDDPLVVIPSPPASVAPDASASPGTDNGVGLVWTQVADPDVTTSPAQNASMNGVIAGGPGAIAWGYVYGTGPRIWTTSDGLDWVPAAVEGVTDADPDQLNPGEVQDITVGGPGYVAVGLYFRQGEGNTSLVWTSADGVTWERVADQPAFATSSMHQVVAWRGQLLAFGCSGGHDLECSERRAWASADGLSWESIELPAPEGFQLSLEVASGDRLWAVGARTVGSARETRWYTSADGRSWTESPLPRYPGPLLPVSGGLLTVVEPPPIAGPDFTPPPVAADRPRAGVYRTADLETWQPLSQDSSSVGNDIIEVGGTMIMVGDDAAGDPACWADCQAMGWRSTDGGVTWKAVPADRVGGTMLDVAALRDGTLVAVGVLLDDRGSPSLAAWVSQPARVASPSPEPTEPTMAPDLARIRCELDGTTTALTPAVRPRADGVHISTTNVTAKERALEVDGIGGDNAGPGTTETVWEIGPGRVRVACYDSSGGPAPDDAWAELTVVDPDGNFVSTALDCTDATVGGGSYPAGAPGWVGDPVDLTRALIAATHPGYSVKAAGYLMNDKRQVLVVDGDRAIARLSWMRAGADQWLLEWVTTCGGIDLGLGFDALDPMVASPSPDAAVGATWTRSALPGSSVPATGGSMDGVIVGGAGAIAWGQVYGEVSRVWTTADGRTWIRAAVEAPPDVDPDIEEPGFISSIAAGGPGYVAVGWYGRQDTGRRGVVWTSNDGRRWDLVHHDPDFENVLISSVIAWRGELLAYGVRSFGPDEGGGELLAWSSSDGLTWRADSLAIPAGYRRGDPVVTGDRLWASGTPADEAAALDSSQHRWLTSTDGRAWSVADLPFYGRSLYPTSDGLVTVVPPSWTTGPETVGMPDPGLYRSGDGVAWQPVSEVDLPSEDLLEVGTTYVVVGDDSDADSQCPDACRPVGSRSVDGGVTWSQVAADDVNGTMLHTAALSDGTLVAVGRVFGDGAEVGPAAWVSEPD